MLSDLRLPISSDVEYHWNTRQSRILWQIFSSKCKTIIRIRNSARVAKNLFPHDSHLDSRLDFLLSHPVGCCFCRFILYECYFVVNNILQFSRLVHLVCSCITFFIRGLVNDYLGKIQSESRLILLIHSQWLPFACLTIEADRSDSETDSDFQQL